jgi:hypothetical protein
MSDTITVRSYRFYIPAMEKQLDLIEDAIDYKYPTDTSEYKVAIMTVQQLRNMKDEMAEGMQCICLAMTEEEAQELRDNS